MEDNEAIQVRIHKGYGYLEQAGRGFISGRVSEWPQLKPACAYAAEVIRKADALAAALESHRLSWRHDDCGCGQFPTSPSDPDCTLCKLNAATSAYQHSRKGGNDGV